MVIPKRHSDDDAPDDNRRSGEAANPEVPGSALFASLIERRRFLRRGATALFYTVAGATVGSLATARTALGKPADSAGPCCPSCCGPSPCCNTSCCDKPCCSVDSTSCADNGSTCLGPDYRYYGSGVGGCWTCVYSDALTTCCDCKINNNTGCSGYTNRCICSQSHVLVAQGAAVAH